MSDIANPAEVCSPSRDYGKYDGLAVGSGDFSEYEITFLSSAVKEKAAMELMNRMRISFEGLMTLTSKPATQARRSCLLPQLCAMLRLCPE